MPDIEYLRGFWRVENRWAGRIYGAVTPTVVRRGFAYVHPFRIMRRPMVPMPPGPLRARETTETDELLRHLRAHVDPMRLQADDLVRGEFFLETLSARFAKVGLERSRRLLVVKAGGQIRGWALLERTSPGLTWIERSPMVKLILVEPEAPDALEVQRALIDFATEDQERTGAKYLSCFAEMEQQLDLEQLGFVDLLGPAMEFCAHRSMNRVMTSYFDRFFERVRTRRMDADEASS